MIVVVVEQACVFPGQQRDGGSAGGSVVIQAYRFAVDPSPQQQAMLASHCGAARFAFNWGLARVRAVLAQRSAERSYGLAEAELTPAVSWSAYSLRKT